MRLIDAHSLWTAIQMLPHNGDMISSEEVEQTITDAHTVDAVPVVHGKWICIGRMYDDDDCRYKYWECSLCKEIISSRYGLRNYCPDCGARMDLEDMISNGY